jgi:cytochrome b561
MRIRESIYFLESVMSLLHPFNHTNANTNTKPNSEITRSSQATQKISLAHYDIVTQMLHWTIITLFVLQYFSGWLIPPLDGSPSKVLMWHASVGSLLFILLIGSLIWAIVRPYFIAQPLPYTPLSSKIIIGIIYILALTIPVIGWLETSYQGWSIKLAGIIPLPNVVFQGSNAFSLGQWHMICAGLLLFMVVIYLANLLYHHLMTVMEKRHHIQ